MNYVSILDLGISNIFSIDGLFKNLGYKTKIISSPQDVAKSKIIVIPGVGSFPAAMNYLNKKKLINSLKRYAENKNPIIGICLGMQLLFEKSTEFGNNEGLGILQGEVEAFKNSVIKTHIGWNKVFFNKDNIFYKYLKKEKNDLYRDQYYYFVHSFYPIPNDQNLILTETNYGSEKFCSSILNENILALQFHPEKSSKDGINLISNFLKFLKIND